MPEGYNHGGYFENFRKEITLLHVALCFPVYRINSSDVIMVSSQTFFVVFLLSRCIFQRVGRGIKRRNNIYFNLYRSFLVVLFPY